MSTTSRHSFDKKREWVLAYIGKHGNASTFDEEFHDAWFARFGGKVMVYTQGPNRCPDANRTLHRMWVEGELLRTTSGNQEARNYWQPTWFRTYRLTFGESYDQWYSRWYARRYDRKHFRLRWMKPHPQVPYARQP